MAKAANRNKRAERRAPAPDPRIDLPNSLDESATPAQSTSTTYKPYQHSEATAHPSSSKKKSAQGVGKASRAKKEKAIARADKVNAKFLTNKARSERKKLMKS
ncbi:hypothetical protein BCV70DRAFT_238555 [Testicularia cyperi]|uniref:Uncharacterized protein n=1 Tax=Testicularia cyperi TaxID=1882483 RepID=A0A317XJE8_9BASI|nr:hypothetical protein BCV70DRAFT_238555 [Testicularia cyperi]